MNVGCTTFSVPISARNVDGFRIPAAYARSVRGLAVWLCAAVALAAVSAADGAVPAFPPRTLTFTGVPGRLGGPVGPVALDGRYAAYSIVRDSMKGCPFGARVYRLDLATGRSTPASGHAMCSLDQTSTGSGLFRLATAGNRVAWLVNEGGNTESGELLFSSTATAGRDTILARSGRTGPDLETLTGTTIGGLVSDGTRISYSTWTVTKGTAGAPGALDRLPGPKQIASDPAAVVDASADAGRVAVLRADGSVAIFGIAGQTLQTVAPPPTRAIALSGDLLAVLTSARTVLVYDRTSGALLHTWPIAAGATSLDASKGIAVYAAPHNVHLLDLTTGDDVTVAAPARAQISGARIDVAGALYGENTRTGGKVVFIPSRRWRRALARRSAQRLPMTRADITASSFGKRFFRNALPCDAIWPCRLVGASSYPP